MRSLLALCCLLLALPAGADRPAAEQAVRDGDAAYAAKDFAKAIEAYSRAVEADRDWAQGWGKRGTARYRAGLYTAALEDLGIAEALDPDTKDWRFWRAQTYLYLDRVTELVEESEALSAKFPDDLDAMSLHGRALVRAGDVDGGVALQEQAFSRGNKDPRLPVRTDGYFRRADWETMRAAAEEAITGGAPSTVLHLHRVIAAVEKGDFDGAKRAVADITAKMNSATAVQCKLYLESTPTAGASFDNAATLDDAASVLASSNNAETTNVVARAYFLVGRPRESLQLLESRGRRTNFETLFWLGASLWKLDRLAEARAALQDAKRYNPYLAKHAGRVAGFGDFLASVDRDMAVEGGANQERGRLGRELAVHLLTVAEIETLVRRYRFQRAADEYALLLQTLKSEKRRAEVEQRLPEVKGMAGALARMIGGVGSGRLKLKATVGKSELTITASNAESFQFSVAGGQGIFPWAFLDPAIFCDLALQADLSPEEKLGLGCLAFDAGLRERASALFADAVKSKAALKSNVTAFVARRRGLAPPDGGFTWFRGAFATAEEKQNLEKGLLPWQGGWVPAKDREMLAKGFVQVGGKWMPGEEAELTKKGFRKQDGKWVTAEEYEEFHQKWENAWTEETAHYAIRTNESEAFAKDLASIVEPAYEAYKTYYGGAEPKLASKEKMTLYAFRTFEDYRKWCVEQKAENQLAAAGYAKSDSLIVVGWNKTSNRIQFLQTMVHEAAHLYHYRIAPTSKTPSWLAEGMATYFEGFDWDGKAWKFGAVPDSRLPRIRAAMQDGKHIPLAEFFKGDALALINSDAQKALLFYSECWALNYYMTETGNKAYKAAWKDYVEAIEHGRDEPLSKFVGDMDKFEKDWIRFVTGL